MGWREGCVCESGLKSPFNHSCSCHRLQVGFGTAVYAGVCGCRCGELIWTCLVWTEPPTPDSFGMPSHRLNSATGEQKWITHTNILWPGQSLAKLINLMPNAKLRSSFYVFGVPRSGIDVPAQGMPGTVRQWMKALGIIHYIREYMPPEEPIHQTSPRLVGIAYLHFLQRFPLLFLAHEFEFLLSHILTKLCTPLLH